VLHLSRPSAAPVAVGSAPGACNKPPSDLRADNIIRVLKPIKRPFRADKNQHQRTLGRSLINSIEERHSRWDILSIKKDVVVPERRDQAIAQAPGHRPSAMLRSAIRDENPADSLATRHSANLSPSRPSVTDAHRGCHQLQGSSGPCVSMHLDNTRYSAMSGDRERVGSRPRPYYQTAAREQLDLSEVDPRSARPPWAVGGRFALH